ncbi:MAG TPA: response regulator transcription factor [Bacteroidia bacterium]|nr:response regulator transcription factor [Bacteroidia bacterium]
MVSEKVHFLLIIDDKAEALLIENSIKKVVEGNFFTTGTFKKAEEYIAGTNKVDIIISALQLQDRDAIDFIYALKAQGKKHYYIVLSNDSSSYIEKEAYKAGANDYLTKNNLDTIGLKIKNLVSYLYGKNKENTPLSNIIIDEEKYLVLKENTPHFLPAKEFEIIKLFCAAPEKIFSRNEIATSIWKDPSVAKSRIIDVHITHIRKVLGKEIIRSVKKIGYGLRA